MRQRYQIKSDYVNKILSDIYTSKCVVPCAYVFFKEKFVKKVICLLLLVFLSINALASHNVQGYYRKNGTYVQPHRSMDPGESKSTGMSYHDNQLVPRDENDDLDNPNDYNY